MKTYGLTHEQLAMVSVVQREWAAKNPRATFKTPITVEDVLNSRMIAYPFRLLQCCLVTDGGGASILVAAERARDFRQSLPLVVNRGAGLPARHRRERRDADRHLTRHSRESGNLGPQGFQLSAWTPASAGVTIIHCASADLRPRRSRLCAARQGRRLHRRA
jgi:acetyl-CoA acetyltransferase